MTRWTTLQVLSIQCRFFENTNVIVRHCYVQTSAVLSQLLQLDVMHSLARLQVGMSAHSSSLNFYRRKERKDQQNLECHNTDGSTDGTRMQMEFQF
jgi:hypothetical protein